jgi:hypothetical protein
LIESGRGRGDTLFARSAVRLSAQLPFQLWPQANGPTILLNQFLDVFWRVF